MQKTYITTLYELMKKDKRVLSLLSDSGTDLDDMVARELPDQVLNFGISENNKVAAASGLASCGKIPFVYTTSAFLAYRSYEFIRDDICLQNRNVKLVGMGCGLSWSTLGPTHHTTEDISALKAIPNLTILSPASPTELDRCIKYAYENDGPFYIRIGMGNEKEIYNKDYSFSFGIDNVIKEGTDAIIFSTGSIIEELLEANELLLKDDINIELINVSTIKPFDEITIVEKAKNNKILISVEEHNVIGGIGSSIADVLAKHNINAKLYKIGLNDCFAHGYGTYKQIKEMNHLDGESLYKSIKDIISNK